MSADFPVGVPFNIASYGLLTMMIAHCTNMIPDELIWVGGDTHIYLDQLEGVKEQLSRKPLETLPKIKLNKEVKNIFDFKMEDIELVGYKHHAPIKFKVSV